MNFLGLKNNSTDENITVNKIVKQNNAIELDINKKLTLLDFWIKRTTIML